MIGRLPPGIVQGPPGSTLVPRSSPTEAPYTMSECFYQVSISGSQKVILGFMGTSLVINFGILIWWLRLYCYKRTIRKRQEQAKPDDYPDESDTEDLEMDRRPAVKEIEEYVAYRKPTYHVQDDRNSLADETRRQRSQNADHLVDSPPNTVSKRTREVVNDRIIRDQVDTHTKNNKGKAADIVKKREMKRRDLGGPESDTSGSESAGRPNRPEKRGRSSSTRAARGET